MGDFGGIWDWRGETKNEAYWLDWLNDKPWTTLFVDGNHENFTRLETYDVAQYHGGNVHKIRESVMHLTRGEIFDLGGYKCFTFGGANSHDADVILDPNKPDFKAELQRLSKTATLFRVLGVSWWPEERPSQDEYMNGLKNLDEVGFKVDYIFAHEAPNFIRSALYREPIKDVAGSYLQDYILSRNLQFNKFYCGHDHINTTFDNYHFLYEKIEEIYERNSSLYWNFS